MGESVAYFGTGGSGFVDVWNFFKEVGQYDLFFVLEMRSLSPHLL